MKVLHLISSGGMYGAEAVILNLSKTLNQGPDQSVLGAFANSSQPNLQLFEHAAASGIQAHAIACNGQFDRSVPTSLHRLVQQTGADIVHAHGYKADVYAWLAFRSSLRGSPRSSQVRLVSTCHTWYDTNLSLRLYGALDRVVLRGFAGVVAVSDQVRQRLLNAGVRENRVQLIRNGIDLTPFEAARQLSQSQHQADRPLTVGLVGRLSWEKNVDLFLRSAAQVLAHLPSTRFLVVGDGADRPKLEALLDQLGIRSNVTLLGRTENMPAVYASFDLMVSSSRQEGLPIAILEGMASSLPVVATAVGAVPTVVRDGVTGSLVPSEDPEALSSAILHLLQNPHLRHSYGAAARQLIADDFSAARMTADYLHLYRQVLNGSSA